MSDYNKKTMGAAEWLMLITLSILWGGSFFFNGVAVRELPPFTIVLLRTGIAAIILLVFVQGRSANMPRDAGTWLSFFIMGFLNNVVPFSLIVWGQTHIASGLASILNATTPLFTVIAAHFMTHDEKITGYKIAGIIVGFAGVVVMIGPAALQHFGANVVAQLACLAGAISYALAGIFGRRFRERGVDPMATATGQVVASTIMLLPLTLAIDQPWMLSAPGPVTWGAIFGVAFFSTALAYVLYFKILSTAGATNLLLVTFLIPVSAIFLGSIILGERLAAQHILGMILIGGGLIAIDGRLLRRREPSMPRASGS